MASLAEIRARLQAAESKQGGNQSTGGDNAIYPHWSMEEGASATLRFLPDGNTKSVYTTSVHTLFSLVSQAT